MIHPSTRLEFISEEKGFGVVATEFIPKGTITWVQDKLDREFTPEEMLLLGAAYAPIFETYSFRNNVGNYILCWDYGRFVNHSFRSNCMTTPYNFEIAIRDIHPGEELTDDYGYLNIEAPFEALPEDSERTVVYPDDLLRHYPEWDAILDDGIRFLKTVPQPLFHLLPEEVVDKLNAVLNKGEKMDSILACYYDPGEISVKNGQQQ